MYKLRSYRASILIIIVLTLSVIGFTMNSTQALPNAMITLLPPAGPVGTPITVKGTNFIPGSTVELSWFGYIVDVPGVSGHVGYYSIKNGITVALDGSFVATVIAPYDFSDIAHYVNATQNGVGTGIVNATFTIVPSLQLSPLTAKYKEGQDVVLHVYGAPRGPEAVALGLSPRPTIIKFTYDNSFWGFATSHFVTEGPIVSGGFVGGDIGGNATITFKAVGGVGEHVIRAYIGEQNSPPYLPCLIGGEAVFFITGPGKDTQAALSQLGLPNETADTESGLANTSVNYGLYAIALSAISLLAIVALSVRVFRKR